MSGEIRSCGGRVEDAPMIAIRDAYSVGGYQEKGSNLAVSCYV